MYLSRLSLCVLSSSTLSLAVSIRPPDRGLVVRQANPVPGLLENFQVAAPVFVPQGTSNRYGCIVTQTLMEHNFAFSYGQPFVGSYNPPSCAFNRVTINFTVTSRGRQFDRLGSMYLGDIEVFRTSTSEPTQNGIIWTYIKEMQQYDSLWKQPQKIIFDLGNLVDDTYTGIFNTTLTATFFTIPGSPAVADTILPISARLSSSNQPSIFQIPRDNASTAFTLPKNIRRAVVSLQACGQSTEEFWYSNVLSSDTETFAPTVGSLYGGSPFREVQLLIDGQLAGVSWPFPIIFTGGIVPGFWRPIAGIDAYDLREHEIDITPWLGYLLDGASHNFEIRVASLSDDGRGKATLIETPGDYWLVSGKIFLFLDKAGSVTTGTRPSLSAPPPTFSIASAVTTNSAGANETLAERVTASRLLSISSTVRTSAGSQRVTWTQRLTYSNDDLLTAQGSDQDTRQTTYGRDTSTLGYSNTYAYPISVNSSFAQGADGSLSLNGSLSRGLTFDVYGPSVFPSGIQAFNVSGPSVFHLPGDRQMAQQIMLPNLPKFSAALLNTQQSGAASYFSGSKGSFSFGTTVQDFSFNGIASGLPGATYELYSRHVKAVNSTVVEDQERLAGQTLGIPTGPATRASAQPAFGGFSVKSLLGRGPGKTKAELSGGLGR